MAADETVEVGFSTQVHVSVPQHLLPRPLIMQIGVTWVDLTTVIEMTDIIESDVLLMTVEES